MVEGSIVGAAAPVGAGAEVGTAPWWATVRSSGRVCASTIASPRPASGRQPPPAEARGEALVTGGPGFIGSTLVDRLLAEGHEVDVLDDLSTGSLANLAEARADRTHRLRFHQIDVRDAQLVDLIARRAPEVVYHLAAQVDVGASVARPAHDAEVNVIGTVNVVEGARVAGGAQGGGACRAGPCTARWPAASCRSRSPRPWRLLAVRRVEAGWRSTT